MNLSVGVKVFFIRLVQAGVFLALAVGASAFMDEFIDLGGPPIYELILFGIVLAVIYLLVTNLGKKAITKYIPAEASAPHTRRTFSVSFVALLLVLSPFVIIFGSLFLAGIINKMGF